MIGCPTQMERLFNREYKTGGWLSWRLIGLTFAEPLKRASSEPGHFRVAAFSRFTQLPHRFWDFSLRQENGSEIQPRPREIRAQPDRLLILRRGFRHLSRPRPKTTQ